MRTHQQKVSLSTARTSTRPDSLTFQPSPVPGLTLTRSQIGLFCHCGVFHPSPKSSESRIGAAGVHVLSVFASLGMVCNLLVFIASNLAVAVAVATFRDSFFSA